LARGARSSGPSRAERADGAAVGEGPASPPAVGAAPGTDPARRPLSPPQPAGTMTALSAGVTGWSLLLMPGRLPRGRPRCPAQEAGMRCSPFAPGWAQEKWERGAARQAGGEGHGGRPHVAEGRGEEPLNPGSDASFLPWRAGCLGSLPRAAPWQAFGKLGRQNRGLPRLASSRCWEWESRWLGDGADAPLDGGCSGPVCPWLLPGSASGPSDPRVGVGGNPAPAGFRKGSMAFPYPHALGDCCLLNIPHLIN
jgi:hypothetical protein